MLRIWIVRKIKYLWIYFTNQVFKTKKKTPACSALYSKVLNCLMVYFFPDIFPILYFNIRKIFKKWLLKHDNRNKIALFPWTEEPGRLRSMGSLESDTSERLHLHFSLSCIGEGNGNPLQCSCLENPRDRGAWWAAVYGVAQSRTWLKWLSSSSYQSY